MDGAQARSLFDANAQSYDRVNRVISFGLDSRWYDWAARRAVTHRGAWVLDAFAGTGGVGLRAARLGARVVLADVSPRMLEVAASRAAKLGLDVRTIVTDLTDGSISENGFDAVTVMWGLRYLSEGTATLRRLARLLSPEGRMVIVDFVEPSDGVIARIAAWYFFGILPHLAGLLSGKRRLYRELAETTHAMGTRDDLRERVEAAGLAVVEEHVMGFGLCVGMVAVPGDPVRSA